MEIKGQEQQEADLQISSLADIYGNTEDIGFMDFGGKAGDSMMGTSYENDFDAMYGSYDGIGEKQYTNLLGHQHREKRTIELPPDAQVAKDEEVVLEKVFVDGKRYTDITPLIIETPRSVLWTPTLTKIK